MSAIPSNVEWRLRNAEGRLSEFEKDLRVQRETNTRHEEQINGETGLISVMHEVKDEVGNLRKALYTATGGIVLAAISIASSIALYAH